MQNAKTRIPLRIMVASNNQAKSKLFIREVRKNPGILCLLSKVFIMFHIKILGLDVLSGISCAKLPIFFSTSSIINQLFSCSMWQNCSQRHQNQYY